MQAGAIIVGILLGTLVLIQVLRSVAYIAVFYRHPRERIADHRCPRVAVLMGLKGTDPSLADGLRRLLTQDYPEYKVHFVVDTRVDPAWSLVEAAIAGTGATHATIQEFRDIPEHGPVNCTNSKIVQALRGLGDGSCEVVAMADGDVVTDQHWLKDLVTPLVNDESIGVTSGNRWFMPPRLRAGSVVRSLWGMVASNFMYQMNMPWGGCLAIRTSAIRDGDLIEKWSKVAALDMVTTREMRKLGLKVEFVPTLMMVNREECSLPFSFNFIRRQLTWAKLYNPAWPIIFSQSIVAAVLIVAALALIVFGAATHDFSTLAWPTAGLSAFCGGQAAMAIAQEKSMRHALAKNGQQLRPLTTATILFLPLGILLVAFVQLFAVLHCQFCKRISWRGSLLEFNGPHDIRVVGEVRPALSSSLAQQGAVSR